MFDDIVIGKPKGIHIASAIIIHELQGKTDCSISENSVSYWISGCIMGFGLKLYKDTPEAKKLAIMIESRKYKQIDDFVDKEILRRVKPKIVRQKLNDIRHRSVWKGECNIREKLRDLIGIEPT